MLISAELAFVKHSMSKRPMPPFDQQAREGFSPVGKMLRRFEAKEEARSMSILPEELVEHICQFAVKEVEDVGPLALTSKQLRASVMSSSVMKELVIRTAERFHTAYDSDDDEEEQEQRVEEKAALLEVYLRQAAEHYPLIGGVDFGDDSDVLYVRNVHVQVVSSFRSLKRLNLQECSKVTKFTPLSSLTSIEDLDLNFTNINDEGLLAIMTSLTRMTKLDVAYCNSITAGGFACLSLLTSLEDLNLDSTNITEQGLLAITTSLTRLTELNLSNCNSIAAEGFACLSSLTSLEALFLCRMNINEQP